MGVQTGDAPKNSDWLPILTIGEIYLYGLPGEHLIGIDRSLGCPMKLVIAAGQRAKHSLGKAMRSVRS
jgi:hypothetical protein